MRRAWHAPAVAVRRVAGGVAVAQLADRSLSACGTVVQLHGAGDEHPRQRRQVRRRLEGDHLVVPALVHQLGLQPQVPVERVQRG